MPTSTTTHNPNASVLPANRTNRLAILMAHTARYAFEPQARLARDVGVSRSTIRRIVGGKSTPALPLALRITSALEAALHRPLDTRDVFADPCGCYKTRSGCQAAGCGGCMPEAAHDRHGRVRSEFRHLRPGDWTLTPEPERGPA